MRKLDILILVVLMVLSAANSFAAVLSTSDSKQRAFFEQALSNPSGPFDPSSSVIQNLMAEVNADIDSEARAAGKTRDQYLSTDAPFELTLNALQSDDLKKMDRIDVTISIIKLGIRYRNIEATRFPAPKFFEHEQNFLRLIREISAQHHLPFQI